MTQSYEQAIELLEGKPNCLHALMHLRRAQMIEDKNRDFDPKKESFASVLMFIAIVLMMGGLVL